MIRLATLAAAVVLSSAFPARADTAASAPAGWIRFCTNNPSFCERHDPASISMDKIALIQAVNDTINAEIKPAPLATDAERREETRNWRVTLAGDAGVCVEYSIDKYLALDLLGVPAGAMRFAQVHRAGDDVAHLVVLIRVDGVEMVLDSLTPAIIRADRERWEWLAVQDSTGPNALAWVKPDGVPIS